MSIINCLASRMILPRWFPRPYNHLLPLQPTSAAQLIAENWQHCLIAAVKKEEKKHYRSPFNHG